MQSALTQSDNTCTPNHWGLPGQLPRQLPCSTLGPVQGKKGFPPDLTGGSRSEEMHHLTGAEEAHAFRNPGVGGQRATCTVSPAAGAPEEQAPGQTGWRPSAARGLCRELRRRGPAGRGLPGPLPATSSASAGRSCQLSSGGTTLRVYMRNHMVTSSSWWATRRVTSSAVELPHPCEMQRGAGSGKAGCSGAWLLRQQAAEQ